MNNNLPSGLAEFYPVFRIKNILLVADNAPLMGRILAKEFEDFFDEILRVTELIEAENILKSRLVTHLVISERFSKEVESAELIRNWKQRYSNIGRAVLFTERKGSTIAFNTYVDALVRNPRSPNSILHALLEDPN